MMICFYELLNAKIGKKVKKHPFLQKICTFALLKH